MTKEDSNPVSLSKKKTENAAKCGNSVTSWANLGLMEKIEINYANGNE